MFDWARKLRDPIRYYSSKALESAADGSDSVIEQIQKYRKQQVDGINAGVEVAGQIYNDETTQLRNEVEFQSDIARVKRRVRR